MPPVQFEGHDAYREDIDHRQAELFDKDTDAWCPEWHGLMVFRVQQAGDQAFRQESFSHWPSVDGVMSEILGYRVDMYGN